MASDFGVIIEGLVVAFIPGFAIVPIELDLWAFAVALNAPIAMTVKIMFFEVMRYSLSPASLSIAVAKRARDVQFKNLTSIVYSGNTSMSATCRPTK